MLAGLENNNGNKGCDPRESFTGANLLWCALSRLAREHGGQIVPLGAVDDGRMIYAAAVVFTNCTRAVAYTVGLPKTPIDVMSATALAIELDCQNPDINWKEAIAERIPPFNPGRLLFYAVNSGRIEFPDDFHGLKAWMAAPKHLKLSAREDGAVSLGSDDRGSFSRQILEDVQALLRNLCPSLGGPTLSH